MRWALTAVAAVGLLFALATGGGAGADVAVERHPVVEEVAAVGLHVELRGRPIDPHPPDEIVPQERAQVYPKQHGVLALRELLVHIVRPDLVIILQHLKRRQLLIVSSGMWFLLSPSFPRLAQAGRGF